MDILQLLIFALICLDLLPISNTTKGVKTANLREKIQKARLRNSIYAQRRKMQLNSFLKNSTMIDYSPEECPHCRVEKCAEEEEDEERESEQDTNLFCYVSIEKNRKNGAEPKEQCATGTQLSKLVNQSLGELENTWEGCQIFKSLKICWCRIEIGDDEEDEEPPPPPEEFDDQPQRKSRLNMVQQRIRNLATELAPTTSSISSHFLSISTTSILFIFFQLFHFQNF